MDEYSNASPKLYWKPSGSGELKYHRYFAIHSEQCRINSFFVPNGTTYHISIYASNIFYVVTYIEKILSTSNYLIAVLSITGFSPVRACCCKTKLSRFILSVWSAPSLMNGLSINIWNKKSAFSLYIVLNISVVINHYLVFIKKSYS